MIKINLKGIKMNESNSIVVYNSRLEQMADEALINNSDFFSFWCCFNIFYHLFVFIG